ncbi:MAG: patatin-like phospholipase family protein [Actinomycetota bacterium]
MENSDAKKTFPVAITMAGAISAGAYTAGVMDYLLETLDSWTKMKQKANDFFEKYPFLKVNSWEDFKKTSEFAEIAQDEKYLADLRNKTIRYKAVPNHDIKIEIMSGASAGGMTAAIASLVLQLENKHHVKFLPDVKDKITLSEIEEIKENNRLFNSWVNLTSDDMLSVLLSGDDIRFIGKPVSALNSLFIRQICKRALHIDETDNIVFAPYVSDDFNLFVTLTNLEGYQKSLNINNSGKRSDLADYGEFITYNHSDLVMFSFGENEDKGTVHIDFNRQNDPRNAKNIKLLSDAAVATGAFPIGLEYASFRREPEFINDNFLIRQIHADTQDLVDKDNDYLTSFIDGGLINNEPFELTDCLLKARLKTKLKNHDETIKANKEYMADFEKKLRKKNLEDNIEEDIDPILKQEKERWFEMEVRRQKNYTILMIDPFPSERKPKKEPIPENQTNYYPFDLMGVIAQLVATMRSQILVKTNLFNTARDINDFSCYLIAPRRRRFQKTPDGKVMRGDDGRPLPVYEKNQAGEDVMDENGKKIVKVYDGSAAIACGSLGGFGGFLDKSFREHDFFLGRLNCQSFLRKHFRIKSDGENSVQNAVTTAYSDEAKKIFQIECGAEYIPIIPEMDLLKAETKLSTENISPTPDELYWKLPFPKYDLRIFAGAKENVLNRIWLIIDSLMKINKIPLIGRKYVQLGFFFSRKSLFKSLYDYIEKQLRAWDLIR